MQNNAAQQVQDAKVRIQTLLKTHITDELSSDMEKKFADLNSQINNDLGRVAGNTEQLIANFNEQWKIWRKEQTEQAKTLLHSLMPEEQAQKAQQEALERLLKQALEGLTQQVAAVSEPLETKLEATRQTLSEGLERSKERLQSIEQALSTGVGQSNSHWQKLEQAILELAAQNAELQKGQSGQAAQLDGLPQQLAAWGEPYQRQLEAVRQGMSAGVAASNSQWQKVEQAILELAAQNAELQKAQAGQAAQLAALGEPLQQQLEAVQQRLSGSNDTLQNLSTAVERSSNNWQNLEQVINQVAAQNSDLQKAQIDQATQMAGLGRQMAGFSAQGSKLPWWVWINLGLAFYLLIKTLFS